MKPYTNFRKSKDPNIVIADCITTEEIRIDKLKEKIAQLDNSIKSIGEAIPTEDVRDERIIALIKMHNALLPDKKGLEKKLTEFQAVLAACETAE